MGIRQEDERLGDRGEGARPGVGAVTGRRFPTLGFDSLALILLASYSVHANWISAGVVSSIRVAVNESQIITGYICILIVGSILRLDFRPLVQILPRLLLVAFLASLMAVLVGMGVGYLVGIGGVEVLFLIVVPVLGGGVSAGALPLALGYGNAFGSSTEILAVLLPSVLMGNFTAIFFAGVLGSLGSRRRGKTIETMPFAQSAVSNAPPCTDVILLATAVGLLIMTSIAAYWVHQLVGISEPISLLMLTGILLATDVVPKPLRCAIDAVYRFSAKVFIVPILIIVGLLYSPWDVLLAGFSLSKLLVIAATVSGLCIGGLLLANLLKLEPIDGTIVAVSRAAMGGTGDIAMLSAARRLYLMPFAQIVTRLGGAGTVFFALLAM